MSYIFAVTTAGVVWLVATLAMIATYYASQSKRVRLAVLALRGEDYRHPPMGANSVAYETIDTQRIDDPQTALMLRASDAERRFYALSILREKGMDDLDSGRFDMAHDEYVRQIDEAYWSAKEDARKAIASRLERERIDADAFTDKVVYRDPQTKYKSVFAVPYHEDRDVSAHRADTVAEQVLEEIATAE